MRKTYYEFVNYKEEIEQPHLERYSSKDSGVRQNMKVLRMMIILTKTGTILLDLKRNRVDAPSIVSRVSGETLKKLIHQMLNITS